MTRILREREVKHITGLSRVTRWRMEQRGEFPRKIRLAQRCVGWSASEVMDWLKARAEESDVALTEPTKRDEEGGTE